MRHAYDRGIRFFECADSYPGMHQMLGEALKGIPRDSYRLMTKLTTTPDGDPQAKFDTLRKLAQTDYFDIALLHWQRVPTWPADTVRWQDGILEAESKKIVIGHGASVHGLPALRQVPNTKWLQIGMIRMNHKGAVMDTENDFAPGLQANVPEVVQHVHEAKANGLAVISMKLCGEGRFTERSDRQEAMKFAFKTAGVDCVTVGTKSPAEVDEAIENLNLALAS